MLKVVIMILLLVPTVTIVLSTASVHAADRMIPSSMLSKAAQHEHTFRHLLNPPTLAVKQQSRFLQNGTGASPTPAPGPGYCDSLASDSIFNDTTCICEEESNLDEKFEKIGLLNRTDPDAYTLAFNTLLGEMKDSFNRTCQTPCEQCFMPFNANDNASKLCVLYTNGDSYNTQFRTGNVTFEDILNITSSDIEESAREIYHFEECFHYTSEKFSDIEICATFESEPTDIEMFYCNITYNNVLCNSCAISADDDECITADCTNVDDKYGTMIDTCQKLGLDGPFQFVYILQEADNTTFTVGSCDVDVPEGGPSGPVKSPAKSPATAPSKNNAPTSNGDGSASIFPLTYIALAITSIAMFRNLN